MALLVLSLELFVFSALILDCIDQLTLHLWLTWEVTDAFVFLVVDVVLLEIFILLLVRHVALGLGAAWPHRV